MNYKKKSHSLLLAVLLCSAQGVYSMDTAMSPRNMSLSQFNGPKLTLYNADKTTSVVFDVIDSLQFQPAPFVLPNKNMCWQHAYGYHDHTNEPSVIEYCSSGEKLRCFVCFYIPTNNSTRNSLNVSLVNFAKYPHLLKAMLNSGHVIKKETNKIYYFDGVEFTDKKIVLNQELHKSNRVFSFLEKDDFVSEQVWQVIFAKINEK